MNRLSQGTTDVKLNGQVIEAIFIGSFNENAINEYARKIKAIIDTLHSAKFAMLVDDRAVEGGTPEAYAALNKYNEWLNSQALVAKAFVIDSSMTRSILKQRTPALEKQNVAYFEDVALAREWLQNQLAAA